MADLRQFKENEIKVHEQLYNNLFLLSYFYPTSNDFDAIFKRDMFVKNNKAAFYEVVFYLLNTLNPELTKERLTTWPPYDIKRENKFRAEVFKYINELNGLYDNADIPHMMASHLISPGGIKFARFMLKLSQLVVYEHLQKTSDSDVLYCPKPNKTLAITKANIKKKSAVIEKETREIISTFECYQFQSNEKALSMVDELTDLNNKIRSVKTEFTATKEEFNKKYPSYPLVSSLEEKLAALKTQWENLEVIHNLFICCQNLITYLNSNELVLEHKKEELKLPHEILHIVKNKEELDLKEFFRGLNVLLERKALELPNPTESFIDDNAKILKELNAKYVEINKAITESKVDILNEIEVFKKNFKLIHELNSLSLNVEFNNEAESINEILALPLSDY